MEEFCRMYHLVWDWWLRPGTGLREGACSSGAKIETPRRTGQKTARSNPVPRWSIPLCPAVRLLTLLRPASPPPGCCRYREHLRWSRIPAGCRRRRKTGISVPRLFGPVLRHGRDPVPAACCSFAFPTRIILLFLNIFSLYLHVFDIPERARNTPRNVQRIHEKDE